MTLVEQSARLHHGAVLIHPFGNSNGRRSRLLSNIWLAQHGDPVVVWPEKSIGSTSELRSEYLHAIRAADGRDFEPLLTLHRLYAERLPD